ncbi:MAG: tetratricopeptide repeat protein [Gammaproteobacteria bacterium]
MRTVCSLRFIPSVVLLATAFAGCAVTSPQRNESSSETVSARDALYNAKTRYEYPSIIEALETAAGQDPRNSATRLSLVYAFLKRGQYDKARPYVASLLRDPAGLDATERLWLDALDAQVSDRPFATIEGWHAVTQAFPTDRWAWYELATASANIEDYSGAANAAGEALRIESDPAKWEASWIYYLQSKALFRSGQVDGAIAAARAGKSNASTWRSTYFRMAIAQVAGGNREVADGFVQTYQDISKREGRNNAAYTAANIALFYYELGQYERAIEYAQEAYGPGGGSYPMWALSYSLVEAGRVDEALEVIARSMMA